MIWTILIAIVCAPPVIGLAQVDPPTVERGTAETAIKLPCAGPEDTWTVWRQTHRRWNIMRQSFLQSSSEELVFERNCGDNLLWMDVRDPRPEADRIVYRIRLERSSLPIHETVETLDFVRLGRRPPTNCDEVKTIIWTELDAAGGVHRETRNVHAHDWMQTKIDSSREKERLEIVLVLDALVPIDGYERQGIPLLVAYADADQSGGIHEWTDRWRVKLIEKIGAKYRFSLGPNQTRKVLAGAMPYRLVIGYGLEGQFIPLSGVGVCAGVDQ